MTVLTLADQGRALRILWWLDATHPDLPAAELHIRGHVGIATEVAVEASFHHDPAAFDAWLAALGLIAETSELPMSGGGFTSHSVAVIDGVALLLTLHHRQRDWQAALAETAVAA